jgi:hypothetical protein
MEDFLTLDFDEILEAKTDVDTTKVDTTDTELESTETTEVETVDTDGIEEVEEQEQEVEVDQVKELYSVVANVLPIDENENPTVEWIQEQINDAPRKLLEVAITSMPQDAQNVLGYVANKPDFTMKDLVDYVNQFNPQEVNVETVEGARQYLKSNPQYTKLYDNEELDEELDRLEDANKIVVKAKKLKEAEDAIKVTEATKLVETTKAQNEANITRQREFVKNIQQEVESFGWKDDTKRKVFDNLKNERVQFVNSKLKENPKAVAQMAHIYSFFDEKTGFDKLFEVLEGKEKSKKTLETKDKLQQSKLSGLVKTVTQTEKKEKNGWVPEI